MKWWLYMTLLLMTAYLVALSTFKVFPSRIEESPWFETMINGT